METNAVSNQTSTQQSSSRTTTSVLGKDDFLKILVAQLQNQDPTQPMDDTAFIAQMAQFSALEQMQEMNTAFSYSQAYTLLGRSVSVNVTDENGIPRSIAGTVSGVTTINGLPYININGNLISMEAPITVLGQSTDDVLLQGAAMIGKYVKGGYTDADGVTHNVEGTVSRLAVRNGTPVLYVGDEALLLSEISEVSASAPAAE